MSPSVTSAEAPYQCICAPLGVRMNAALRRQRTSSVEVIHVASARCSCGVGDDDRVTCHSWMMFVAGLSG